MIVTYGHVGKNRRCRHLERRDRAAATFDELFTLSTPREDAPLKLPRPKRPAGLRKTVRAAVPLSDLQQQLLELADMVATVHARARIAPIRKTAAPMKLTNEESARRYVTAVYAEQTAVSDALHGEEPVSPPRRPARKKAGGKKTAPKKGRGK